MSDTGVAVTPAAYVPASRDEAPMQGAVQHLVRLRDDQGQWELADKSHRVRSGGGGRRGATEG
jgi:hypothetical protein